MNFCSLLQFFIDCIIIIWKLSEDEDDHMTTEPSFGSEDVVNKEKWIVHKMLRRYVEVSLFDFFTHLLLEFWSFPHAYHHSEKETSPSRILLLSERLSSQIHPRTF